MKLFNHPYWQKGLLPILEIIQALEKGSHH